jgi:hypothetical protein
LEIHPGSTILMTQLEDTLNWSGPEVLPNFQTVFLLLFILLVLLRLSWSAHKHTSWSFQPQPLFWPRRLSRFLIYLLLCVVVQNGDWGPSHLCHSHTCHSPSHILYHRTERQTYRKLCPLPLEVPYLGAPLPTSLCGSTQSGDLWPLRLLLPSQAPEGNGWLIKATGRFTWAFSQFPYSLSLNLSFLSPSPVYTLHHP